MKGKIIQLVIIVTFVVSMSMIFPADIVVAGTGLLLVILTMIFLLSKRMIGTEKFSKEIIRNYEQTVHQKNQTASRPAKKNTPPIPQPKKETVNHLTDEATEDDIILAINAEAKKSSQSPKLKRSELPRKRSEQFQPVKNKANPYLKKKMPPVQDNDEMQPDPAETVDKFKDNVFNDELEKIQTEEQTFKGVFNPLPANEILSDEDLAGEPEDLEEQAKIMLEKIDIAVKNKDYQDALDTVQSWIDFNEKSSRNIPQYPEIIFLKGKCELMLKYYGEAAKTWKHFFDNVQIDDSEAQKIAEINTLIDSEKDKKPALPVMFALLDYYRSRQNFDQMDTMYGKVIDIYQKGNDRKNLMTMYQNRLSVKKKRQDYDGQLHILDILGKLYFDEGDKKASRACYQESIKIRNEMLAATTNS